MLNRRNLMGYLSGLTLAPLLVRGRAAHGSVALPGSHTDAAPATPGVGSLPGPHENTVEIENASRLGRITCGQKSDKHSLEWIRRFQRDVHAPAIARRPAVYEYRHFSFDPLRPGLFAPLAGIELDCGPVNQLNSLADMHWLDEASYARTNASPAGEVRDILLADIELIQKRSTTYQAGPTNARTFVDTTGTPIPQGPPPGPHFAILLRQRPDSSGFRDAVSDLAQKWAAIQGVRRLRLTCFDTPNVSASVKNGFTDLSLPRDQWHQAWIDLVIDSEPVAKRLLPAMTQIVAPHISALHAYPVIERYTYVFAGRPTLVGLRGYASYEAIKEFHAANHDDPRLLEWMYGPVVEDGPFEPAAMPTKTAT